MSVPAQSCVIVGGGHAAAQLCVSLRQARWHGRITLVGDEPAAPYHRPPLSKSQLDPAVETAVQLIRPVEFYTTQQVDLRLGQTVRSIDREDRAVDIGHDKLRYDVLVLATGSLNRRPPIVGIEHPRVLSLRTAADAEMLRARAKDAKHVAIIGGGFIGLEVASSMRKIGRDVTLLQMSSRVLSRVTSPVVSAYFEALHRHHGVDLRTGVSVTMIREENQQLAIFGSDESVVCRADLVVIGAGARPNDDLARLARLEVNNGILVDERNRASDPAIYAIGDCCNQYHPLYKTRLRIESVQNATDQAKAAAAAICGLPAPPATLPWFWSDQYDVKLQIAGISTGHDQCVVRGDPVPGSSFSAWYLDRGQLIAVDAVNDPRAYVVASKLIPRAVRPDPVALADPGRDLKELL
jgi:3-phenylpropionate/trans-cinnamate dioxygenase ferredoxin reductase subunit